MTYFFYILRCSDNSLYCGITNDLERRLREHNSKTSKSAKYTRAKQPVLLVYKEELETMSSAMRREAEVKRWTKKKKEELVSAISV